MHEITDLVMRRVYG